MPMTFDEVLAAERIRYHKPIEYVIRETGWTHLTPEDIRIYPDYPLGFYAIIQEGGALHRFQYDLINNDWDIQSVKQTLEDDL